MILKNTLLLFVLALILLNCQTPGDALTTNKAHLYPFKLDGKWGYYDYKSNQQIDPKFEDADLFFNGLAIVKLDGQYGYLNEAGVLQVKNKFDHAERFVKGRAKVERKNQTYFINTNGKKIKSADSVSGSTFRDELLPSPEIPGLESFLLENEHGKKAIYFSEFDLATAFEFDSIIPCSREFAIVSKAGKYGFHRIDMPQVFNDKKLHGYKTEYLYDEIQLAYKTPDKTGQPNQFAKIRIADQWGVMSIVTLRELVAPKYIRIVDLSNTPYNKLMLVEYKKGAIGYLKVDGQELFPN